MLSIVAIPGCLCSTVFVKCEFQIAVIAWTLVCRALAL